MTQPKSSKGSRRIVEVNCAAWMDLLGYGSMLRESRFDPSADSAKKAIDRLDSFQKILARNASKYSPILAINDGAVIWRDLSPRSRSVTYDFIKRIKAIHDEVNSLENSLGQPGLRTVVGAGFRVRRRLGLKENLINGIGASLLKRLAKERISPRQAINTALTIKPFFASVPEVRANFAFSRAYLADAGGSKVGLSGPRFFLDSTLFKQLPDWLVIDESINWSTPGMDTVFFSTADIDTRVADACQHEGVRDAYEVAIALTESEEIIDRLRALRVNREVQ